MIGELIQVIASLNGPLLRTYEHFKKIEEPGFYVSSDMTQIEHWSFPCDYTKALSHAQLSTYGLLCDGFLSIIAGDDAAQICQKLNEWHQHLVKYGVVTK